MDDKKAKVRKNCEISYIWLTWKQQISLKSIQNWKLKLKYFCKMFENGDSMALSKFSELQAAKLNERGWLQSDRQIMKKLGWKKLR